MKGCRLILPHHIVAKVDEGEPDEFRDVQDLDVAETRKASADAGKKRANGNENVAEEAGSSPVLREILNGRVDSTAEKKNEGVEVEQWGKSPDPLPSKHTAGQAVIEAFGNFNRRGQYANSGNKNANRAHHRRDVGKAFVHEQVYGSLGEGVSAKQGADDVPYLGVPFAPAENGIDAFGERAEAEREHAQGPPQQVCRPLGKVVRYDAAQEEDRKERGQHWYITDQMHGRNLEMGDAFLHPDRCADQCCSEIGCAIKGETLTQAEPHARRARGGGNPARSPPPKAGEIGRASCRGRGEMTGGAGGRREEKAGGPGRGERRGRAEWHAA